MSPPTARRLAVVLSVAFALRLAAVASSARISVDVKRYHKVAEHVLDVSPNPYQAPRLYPYPPLWVWFEAGAGWLERHGASFPYAIKLPVVLADVGIVGLLAFGSLPAAWVYALHPVSILVTGFHGQFDALMLVFLLAALHTYERGAHDASALALAGAIATKALPVLLLPFFLMGPALGTWRARARFAALALVPVLAMLLPYAIADFTALRRELLAYAGIADFGWIGLYRGLLFLKDGHLLRSRPEVWGALVPIAKLVFLTGFGLILAFARRLRLALTDACLAVFLIFLVGYGSISAQYLLWPVPLGARRGGGFFIFYSIAATIALLGFYPFLAPGVLFADETPRATGALWVVGNGAVLLSATAWLAATLARGRAR